MDNFIKTLYNQTFERISPKQYAIDLRDKFIRDPSLWYDVIIPRNKADELIEKTKNDYSEIWDAYCDYCFCRINKNMLEDCYFSNGIWLCKKCFEVLKGDLKFNLSNKK